MKIYLGVGVGLVALLILFIVNKPEDPSKHSSALDSEIATSSTFQYSAPDSNKNDQIIDIYSSNTKPIARSVATPSQEKEFEKAAIQAEYFAPTMRAAIVLLASGDVNKLLELTHPKIIAEYGIETIKSTYTDRFIPFFKDFTSINEDQGTISPYIADEYSSNGMFYGEFFKTSNGATKNFVIGIVEWEGKPYIVAVDVDTTLEEYGKENE